MSSPDTLASGRFRVGERLGAGAFGEVHRAYDQVHRREIALKLLHKQDPASLARFKREFRSVATIRHPHLVALHSLHRDGERWFFTMDLVDGFDLVPYLRPAGELDVGRARRAFREIAEALSALHESGHVHRDVKPSNVRLAVDGSVRLLDFGFAQAVDARTSETFVGTPLYMAPEVVDGTHATPASDWYAFGVLLFECLASEAPFRGRPFQILFQKREREAPPLPGPDPLGLAPLLARLLDRDPERRPSAAEILEALGEPMARQRRTTSTHFVGRSYELKVLEDAFARACSGSAQAVWIEGEAGSGKTALLERFLQDRSGTHRDGRSSVVLRGRCFPREALPYKGIDDAIDGLTVQLRSWPEKTREAVLPRQMGPLLALFPVLGRITPPGARHQPMGYERSQVRVEAFAALRELLASIAAHHPVIFVLDDLQWADEDGAALLRELLRRMDAPLLFVAAHRPGPLPAGIETLHDELGGEDLRLGGLDSGASLELAQRLLDERGDAQDAARIAGEAAGNPLFVELLARHGRGTTMAEALNRSLLTLEEASRRVLDHLSVAGRPIPIDVVQRATGLPRTNLAPHLDALQASRLATVDDSRVPPTAAAYHDRIAELVVAAMDHDTLRDTHARLASALAVRGGDPEAVAYHYDRAGDAERAADWYERAARRAETALAWERAAQLFERAIEIRTSRGESVAALQIARGDALAHSGRSAEAVIAFRAALTAARGGEVDVAEEDLLRRIAEQLLRSGRMKEGVSALERCLRLQGLRFPRHPAEALATMIALRTKLRLRGLSFTPTSESEIDPRALQRIDTCWSAGVGLSFVDSLRGAGFLTRSLLDALESGESYRVARSLAYEASFLANQGSAGEKRARATLRHAEELADGLGDPHLRALIPGARCVLEFHHGRWRHALERADEAADAFVADAVGMAKEVVTVQLLGAASMVFLGEFAQLDERMDQVIRLAELRRDLFALTSFRSGFTNSLWLAQDDPTRARDEATNAFRGWEADEFLIQHFFDLWAQTQIDLYEGDGASAAARVRTGWGGLKQSLLTRLQFLRIASHDLAGRALIAGGLDRTSERKLGKHVRALRKEKVAWALPLADVLEAGLLRAKDRRMLASQKLVEAAVRFEGVDMGAHAAACRLAHAKMSGASKERQERATDALRARGIAAPQRWIRTVFPEG